MSVINTTNLALHTYEEGENPGAGSQTVQGGGGLNDNWLILDAAVGTQHTAAGAHKSDVITGANLVGTGGTNVADGSTLEFSASTGTKVLRVKDGGLTKAKLATSVADASTIELDATNGLQVKDGGITGAKLKQTGTGAVVDETTLEFSSDEMRIKDAGVTGAKISHDNTRTKDTFTCVITTATGTDYATFHGTALSAARGISMPRAGSITKITLNQDGTPYSGTWAHGVKTFNAGDMLTCYWYDGDGTINVKPVGGTAASVSDGGAGVTPMFVTIEVEYD